MYLGSPNDMPEAAKLNNPPVITYQPILVKEAFLYDFECETQKRQAKERIVMLGEAEADLFLSERNAQSPDTRMEVNLTERVLYDNSVLAALSVKYHAGTFCVTLPFFRKPNHLSIFFSSK